MYNDSFLNKKLDERRAADAFRVLRLPYGKVDFCSNDYLGVIKNNLLQQELTRSAFSNDDHGRIKHGLATGSGGSRLLAGNTSFTEETETVIAAFHQSDTALIFNSGYDANTGVLSCVPQRGDTVIYDALSHASIRDGVRLSFATAFPFNHNDMEDLEKKLQKATGNIFVVTESVFSMDGDICPLAEMLNLCRQYNAHLILDEAHATGVIGVKGEGLAQHLGLHEHVFCRVHTFGKACGCHGAVALGSQNLKDYLVNFSRSFIYTTALPEHAVAGIRAAYSVFPHLVTERKHLASITGFFQAAVMPWQKLPSATPIQVVVVPGNSEAKNLAGKLQQNGLDVKAILYPTVPKGGERLRIVLHAFNTMQEMELLVNALNG
jgi:8-amino-7-oxononanoate synthase